MTVELRAGHGVTPGPRIVRTLENFGWNVVHYRDGNKHDMVRIARAGNEADANYIARCSPENIAAFLDHIEAIRAENERLKGVLADVTANAELRLKLLMAANDALERIADYPDHSAGSCPGIARAVLSGGQP